VELLDHMIVIFLIFGVYDSFSSGTFSDIYQKETKYNEPQYPHYWASAFSIYK
jgi:hypothetical protein